MHRGDIQMVLPMPRPRKHPNGFYYFTVRVSPDLIEKIGKRVYNESLRTKDRIEAKELHALRYAKMLREEALLRFGPTPLTHKQVMALAGQYYEDIRRQHEDDPGDPEQWDASLDGSEELGKTVAGQEKLHGAAADRILLEAGLLIDPQSREALLEQLHRAFHKVVFSLIRIGRGDYSPDLAAASFPPLVKSEAKTAAPVVTLTNLFEKWAAFHRSEDKAARTITDFRGKVQSLIAFVGHDDAEKITRADVGRWITHLRLEKGLTAKTVSHKYLTAVRAVYRVALDDGTLTTDSTAGIRLKTGRRLKLRETSFSDEEAKIILFHAQKAPQADSGVSETNKQARRWIPWICAHTGARGAEIAQLRKIDFMVLGGIHCIEITPDAGSVKTGQFRRVPLHPQLIEIGLLDFVKSRPDGPLFYKPSGRGGNGQAAGVRGNIGEWVREVAGITDKRVQPNHAWRHRFKTVARNCGIESQTSDAITGHDSGNEGNKYGAWEMQAMLTALEKMPRYDTADPHPIDPTSGCNN